MRVAACGGILPFDLSFGAADDFIMAWIVANGESNGGVFDWNSMKWRDRR